MIEFLILPGIACMLLTAIHGYLGLHVLRREVIFLDLALAQLASLGAIAGFMLGRPFGSPASYGISALFTLAGAVILTIFRSRPQRIGQEAFIGIIYVVAAAVSIILLSHAPTESHHLKEMMVGNILFVSKKDVIFIAGLYGVIGLIHWVFRRQFWSASTEKSPNKKWEFAFYVTFGLVVTSSVKLAGVLLVFSLLIIPAAAAAFLTQSVRKQLLIGWALGSFFCIGGLWASMIGDMPPGAAIVAVAGAAIGILWLVGMIWDHVRLRT
ncbi:metal ABC transporter permease [bacterium]|nr:metal ABC transporter permease [bacterium]